MGAPVLDISDIKLISTIAEEGSINKASERLNLSQPTVSKRLNRLEEKLDLELFHRDSSGMVSTQAAQYLQATASELEQQLSVVSRQLELMSNKQGGHVAIGVGPIVEQLFIPKVLLDFAEAESNYSIRIHVDSAENLLRDLRQGNIDIAIGPFASSEAENDLHEVLNYSEPCSCIMRHGHPLAGNKHIDSCDLSSSRLISATVPASMSNEVQGSNAIVFEPSIIYNSFTMAKTIISNSDYLTIGPASIFYRELISEELISKPLAQQTQWTCRCFVKPEVECIPMVREVITLFGEYMS